MAKRPLWYDKQGRPLADDKYDKYGKIEQLLRDEDYARVALDKVASLTISTVWLGLDQNFSGVGPPLLFETMVFHADQPTGLPGDSWGRGDEQERYSTLKAAQAGHEQWVRRAKEGLLDDGA